jgi:energy-coupling factor transporter ATP-binding protein EcfA2
MYNEQPTNGDLTHADQIIDAARLADYFDAPESVVRALPVHDRLGTWAASEFMARFPGQPFVLLSARPEPADLRAQAGVTPGQPMTQFSRYAGVERIACPVAVPLHEMHMTYERTVLLTARAGAYLFHFERAAGEPSRHTAVYVGTMVERYGCLTVTAVVAVPADDYVTWKSFENTCYNVLYRVEPGPRVIVVGGAQDEFEPTIGWEDVILPAALKDELRGEIDSFFTEGVPIYHALNLPAFRKLLLAGPPGTGKSMLCQALAKLAIERDCIAIYVSSSQKQGPEDDGARFDKIHHALRQASYADHPVLLVVEEIDAFLKPGQKSQILNVLDGFEAPRNRRGTLLVMTTNYPEAIDKRIAKRPGRVDRVYLIPPIHDETSALLMLRKYLSTQFLPEHGEMAATLVGQTGAFVREASIAARMAAAQQRQTQVTPDMLRDSITRLANQLSEPADDDQA